MAAATKELHPDCEAVAPERRWTGTLAQLWEALKREAMQDRGTLSRAWRMLPNGACVALTVDAATFKKRVRLSRSSAPQGERGRKAWDVEVATFARHFGLIYHHRWWTEQEKEAKGVAAVLLELYDGEVEPGRAKCYRCGSLCKWDAAHAPDGCCCLGCMGSQPRRAHPAARQLP